MLILKEAREFERQKENAAPETYSDLPAASTEAVRDCWAFLLLMSSLWVADQSSSLNKSADALPKFLNKAGGAIADLYGFLHVIVSAPAF